MALDVLRDCELIGPALPEPFVLFELEAWLTRQSLLPRPTGSAARDLQESWNVYRRKLRELGMTSGPVRVRNQVLEPLVERLGYARIESAPAVPTREEPQRGEAGGHLLLSADGKSRLRVWSTEYSADLDAPARRGAAYRYSHLRVAQRVLLASGERVGLLTNGIQLRILFSDPARPDSQIVIPIDPNWRRSRQVPDSYRLLLALCGPNGVALLPKLVEDARLKQAKVTKDLRIQARQAVERFIQEVLDHPANRTALDGVDREALARELWHEGLILVYRLLFILKLESSDDPARAFSFASTSLWRNTFSPTVALAPVAREVLDHGAETGLLLEDGVRSLCRLFRDGIECTELRVKPLGGALFGDAATPWLSHLAWGERAIAMLLDRLLWTDPRRAGETRRRVHYGPLDVEDLGRVYEALLELEPGIAAEAMCRLRRQKLEVVVPLGQGERYRQNGAAEAEDETEEEAEDETSGRNGKTRVEWVEEIHPGRFYLRVGLGRKASGSYYTPHPFVRFLVQETLGPQVAERSPSDEPSPAEILKLKILDPAMGSGHFLVEACRYLGERLYEAVRFCDEKALEAEGRAARAKEDGERKCAEAEAAMWRERIVSLPDPDDELLAYLPSRAPEGEESGFSQSRALAICKRLVAVHSLYGVDKNPLAVELAKLSLWLETQAEGFPLTFLDHRLVIGDSLSGPFLEHLIRLPGSQRVIEGLYDQDLLPKFTGALREAIRYVGHLEAYVGATVAEIEDKARLNREMNRALAPFRALAAAWAGGVMLGRERSDDANYEALVRSVGHTGDLPEQLPASHALRDMLARGLGVQPEEVTRERKGLFALLDGGKCVPVLSYDLTFPEVFYPAGVHAGRRGFDAVIQNPPWDRIEIDPQAFFGQFDFRVIDSDSDERAALIADLSKNPEYLAGWQRICDRVDAESLIQDQIYSYQSTEVAGRRTLGRPDTYRLFVERTHQLCKQNGMVGWVVPSSFHSNEGATGVRKLYLDASEIRFCYSFENKRRLFEIHSSFKFDVLVAKNRIAGTSIFRAGFYLLDPEWLFTDDLGASELTFTREIVELTGGSHLTFVEARSQIDLELIAAQFRVRSTSWGDFLDSNRITTAFGVEIHRNPDFDNPLGCELNTEELFLRCVSEDWARLPIHAGKTIHQYTDRWEPCSRYVLSHDAVTTRHWQHSVPFYRFAFRMKAASTNERTMIAVGLTPGFVCEQTLAVETQPATRPDWLMLVALGMANSYQFDWQVRQRVTTSLSNYILAPIPIPNLNDRRAFLAHAALRLTCNHVGYENLWRQQIQRMGGNWRESRAPHTWPVLETDDERWNVRSVIDAVVADAYGLTREQYQHVLSTFSHRSYPKAPELCLAKYDELKQIGLDSFTRKYDPYWDVPLNESLPEPVIKLPGVTPGIVQSNGAQVNLLGEPLQVNLFGEVDSPSTKRRKRR